MGAVTRLWKHATIRSISSKVGILFSRRYLFYTNSAISVVMSCTGDALEQHYRILQGEQTQMDWKRSHDIGFSGLLIGAFCHLWYIMLDCWFPGRTLGIAVKKSLVDQTVSSPICISAFLFVTSFFEGKTSAQMKQELKEKGKILYKAEWMVWPPAQIINFYFVPTRYRVMFGSSVSFGFEWYFSFVKYGDRHSKAGALDLVSHDTTVSEDKLTDMTQPMFQKVQSHLPFAHSQSTDIVQLKQDMFHIDSKCLRKRWHEQSCQQ
ncbi:hypothetical protein DPMN_173920 [Dreissena polymorpha]|uniref:Mpv17-like protein 2 n=1 Tax=Dreissena polymorpha TaxID=45954 RepID=A0A9D4IGL2_DREPO|nr:hypothetical protein DPMN_173920 [Dreissena polymorpha]